MQLNTWVSLVAAAVPTALANFQQMRAPSSIVPGSPFNITGAFAPSDKAGYPVSVWLGVFPFNSTKNPTYKPDRSYGSLGLKLAPFDVRRLGGISSYYFTLQDFSVPQEHFVYGNSIYLQWFQIIEFGAANEVAAESYLIGPITAGSQISSALIDASVKSFRIGDCAL